MEKCDKILIVIVVIITAFSLWLGITSFVRAVNSPTAIHSQCTVIIITETESGDIQRVQTHSTGSGNVNILRRGNVIYLDGRQIHPLLTE